MLKQLEKYRGLSLYKKFRWHLLYTMIYTKKPGFNLYHRGIVPIYVTYSVKTWFLKILSVAPRCVYHLRLNKYLTLKLGETNADISATTVHF